MTKPRTPSARTILDVKGLTVAYGKVEAVLGVDLNVADGEIVTVIGPNGAGKTSMLSAVMGLLPARGQISFYDSDLSVTRIEQRVAQGLILVPETRELFSSMSVEDNLLLGAFQRHRTGDRDHAERMGEVFQRFPRLKERRRQTAGTLSGGERAMLVLGRALMAKPRLLMLDEPSLGLAPRVVRDIFAIISDLRASGVSILLVEQNARAALQVSDYGYVLESGEVVAQGHSDELAEDPAVVQSYLGARQGT